MTTLNKLISLYQQNPTGVPLKQVQNEILLFKPYNGIRLLMGLDYTIPAGAFSLCDISSSRGRYKQLQNQPGSELFSEYGSAAGRITAAV